MSADLTTDRCFDCKRSIRLDWDAVVCPCGSVACCLACDPTEACTDCRTDCRTDRAMEAACEREVMGT